MCIFIYVFVCIYLSCCKNIIGVFNGYLVTFFLEQSWFFDFKRFASKMQFLGTIKKLASLFPRLQNAKWRKTSTDFTVIEPKYDRIPIFLHIPRALEQGQICI